MEKKSGKFSRFSIFSNSINVCFCLVTRKIAIALLPLQEIRIHSLKKGNSNPEVRDFIYYWEKEKDFTPAWSGPFLQN